jgi:hypothetical protein
MSTDKNSIQALSPQTIASLLEVLSLGSSGGALTRKDLLEALGYDWAAAAIVRGSLESGADSWHVLRVLSDLVRARTVGDDTQGAEMANAMLDKAEELRAGKVKVQKDKVRWRLLGMVAESAGSQHLNEAGQLLEAAVEIALNAADEDNDSSAGTGHLAGAARDLVKSVFLDAKYLRRVDNAGCAAEAEGVLNVLRQRLGFATQSSLHVMRGETERAHVSH